MKPNLTCRCPTRKPSALKCSRATIALQVVLSLLLHLLDAEIHLNEVLDIPSLQGIMAKSWAAKG